MSLSPSPEQKVDELINVTCIFRLGWPSTDEPEMESESELDVPCHSLLCAFCPDSFTTWVHVSGFDESWHDERSETNGTTLILTISKLKYATLEDDRKTLTCAINASRKVRHLKVVCEYPNFVKESQYANVVFQDGLDPWSVVWLRRECEFEFC